MSGRRPSPPLQKGGQGGIKNRGGEPQMKPYPSAQKAFARELRNNLTDAEQHLWQRLRRKQIHGQPFYRQKPIGPYIVDFYSASARLVIELDGSQHFEPEHQFKDQQRDAALAAMGLHVLRFDNLQVLKETEAVVQVIGETVQQRTSLIPPSPPFAKGGDPLSDTTIPPFAKGGPGGIKNTSPEEPTP